MRNVTRTLALASTALVLAAAAPALAHDRGFESVRVDHELIAVQKASVSQASGEARIRTLPNDMMHVRVRVEGLTPGSVLHMQHLHGFPGAPDMGCPSMKTTPMADANGDGLISVGEGAPYYGPVQVHLNTTGATDGSGDYAVADSRGRIRYERTFRTTAANVQMAERFQVVVHGIDLDKDGMLGSPLEVSIPAVCGGAAD
ncbi:hypothetical protein ACPYOC_14460 [Ornithinimicrobium sp. W1665]|uniref:hypothetical protein n=2 Tax=Ornithinimicrobium sp. W1665 TaxID=3416666 RepID=UPI003CEF6EF5